MPDEWKGINLNSLGADIQREINGWNSDITSLKERWNQTLGVYRMDETQTNINIIDGMQGYATPVMTAKIDALVGNIVTACFGTSPIWQCLTDDSKSSQVGELETALEDIASKSKIEQTVAQAVLKAALCNYGMMMVTPKYGDHDEVVGIDTDWVEPEHAFVFPLNVEDVSRLKAIGHRYYLPKWEVEQKIDSGEWYEYSSMGATDPNEWRIRTGNDLVQDTTTPSPEDGQLQLFQIIRKMKVEGEWGWYLINYGYQGMQVLSIEEYPYELPWYAPMRLLRTEKRIIGNDSIGFKAKGLALLINDLVTTMVHGLYMSAFSPLLLAGGKLPNGTNFILPGMVLEVDDPDARFQSVPSTFNPGEIPLMISQAENWMESAVGVSKLATSQNVAPDTKATTVNALTLSDQRRQNSIYETASEAIELLGQLLLMLFKAHYQEISAAYQGQTVLQDPSVLDAKYLLKATGKAGANPAELREKLNGLFAMSQQPTSRYDPNKIEERIADQLDLPFDPTTLQKDAFTQMQMVGQKLQAAGIPLGPVLQLGLQEWSEQQHAMAAGKALGGMSEQTANTGLLPAAGGSADPQGNTPVSGQGAGQNAPMPTGQAGGVPA